jgi:hypothetical protein
MKFIYYLFYRLYQFGIRISDDSLRVFKPFVIIVFFENGIIIGILSWYSILTEKNHYVTGIYEILLLSVLLLINYFIFIKDGKWKKFSNEYEEYSKRQKIIRDCVGVLLGVAILAFFMISVNILHHKAFFVPL